MRDGHWTVPNDRPVSYRGKLWRNGGVKEQWIAGKEGRD